MTHSRCSIDIISLHPPEWPCGPKAVTGSFSFHSPKGLQQNNKGRSFLLTMNRMLLSGQTQFDWTSLSPPLHFLWQIKLIKTNFEKSTEKEESTKTKIEFKSCSQQEELWGRGQRVGGRGGQAAAGIANCTLGTGNPQTETLSLFPSKVSRCDLQIARRAGLCASSGPDMTEHPSCNRVVSNLVSVFCHILNFGASLISLFRDIQKRPQARKWWGFVLFFSNMHTHIDMQWDLSPSLGGKFAKASVRQKGTPQSFWDPVLSVPSTRATGKTTVGRSLALPGLVKM